MKLKWSTKFPKKTGYYWFYGYRYGKMFAKKDLNPEWMIVRACTTAVPNQFMYVANGQFMYESEVEDAHFAPFELPEFPKLKP